MSLLSISLLSYMDRKKFLRQGMVGLGTIVGISPMLGACGKDEDINPDMVGDCAVSPSETVGPFPIKTPAQLVRENIVSDRTGVALLINITVQDQSNDCQPMEGALVDIWHCDKDGNYSEYSGFSSVHFLRGRQTTDANGLVSFTTIFPGWYTGRATHIHVHVFNAAGTSLKITQIAFPEGSSSAVALVNTTATGYTKGMSGYTYNANDGIFSDDTAGVEIAAISGSVSGGYTLTHIIKVAA